MSDYDSLHRQCRTLESLFDAKLTSYARLASTVTRHQEDIEAGGSAERWSDLEAEVDELLQKVLLLISRVEKNTYSHSNLDSARRTQRSAAVTLK